MLRKLQHYIVNQAFLMLRKLQCHIVNQALLMLHKLQHHIVNKCLSCCVAVAREREVEGDLLLWDMGQGLSFRPGTFDGVISISALQWLCNADKKSHNPHKRLYHFFSSLYASLVSPHATHPHTSHALTGT